MIEENPELFSALVAALPYSFLAGLSKSVPRLYLEAQESVSNDPLLDPVSAEYVIPHYRRGLFETEFLGLGKTAGLNAITRQNSRRTAKYTEVQSGNFIFTASYVNDPSASVRYAQFRTHLSGLNQLMSQLSFTGEGFTSENLLARVESEGLIYCIVLHGPNPIDRKSVGFMKFAFPHPTLNKWLADFDFSQVLQAAQALQPIQQVDNAKPKLKKPKDEESENEGN